MFISILWRTGLGFLEAEGCMEILILFAVQRMCTAVEYLSFSGYVLQFSTDNCLVVPVASPLGMEFVFLLQDASLRAWYAFSLNSPTGSP